MDQRRRTIGRVFALALATVGMLAITAPTSGQSVTLPTLFDDFEAKRIDTTKWRVASTGSDINDSLTRMAELAVEQVSGKLKIELQSYGLVGDPAPRMGNQGQVWLNMANTAADAARGVQVTARVEDSRITGCIASTTSRTYIRFLVNLFRDGPNRYTFENGENVVSAMFQIGVRPDVPKNTLRVNYSVSQSTNIYGSEEIVFEEGAFGEAAVGQDITLGVELDTINNRVILTKNNEELKSVQYPSTLVETFPPSSGHMGKGIWIVQRFDVCPTPAEGWVKVTFDNFRTAP